MSALCALMTEVNSKGLYLLKTWRQKSTKLDFRLTARKNTPRERFAGGCVRFFE